MKISSKVYKVQVMQGNFIPSRCNRFYGTSNQPKLGERIADFACGTGGFLTSALKVLESQIQTLSDRTLFNNSVYGIEKKALPHLLCITNLLLHDIDNPNVHHDNALEKSVKDYTENDKFDVILMNPPYGGSEIEQIKKNFPGFTEQ
ncbi:Probable type I restriction enzyme BthVORF4518P M protein [Mannheimia haemolytica]|uniref:site-specific DNA-methyltransferase (adenine-specific) n=1 Tax=Mannheimia haemolytica TaxID=75985 RepID=A0A378MTS3_MANHA|nr:Probable type I restriction enzyme BthVORF4518P M protein [Mannheimia haemolytica]